MAGSTRPRARTRPRQGAGRPVLTAAIALTLLLTACGQKVGVHVEGQGDAFASAPLATAPSDDFAPPVEQFDDASASVESSSTDSGTTSAAQPVSGGQQEAAGTSSSGAVPSAPSSGSAAVAPAGSGQASAAPTPAAGGQRPVRGSDRTGVTADSILIGTHAPVTGAAPLPVTSFEKSGDLYWRNLIDLEGKDVLGRTRIEYRFRDDRYDPNAARQVCRELEAEAFTFAGGGGTDQIQACGAFAAQAKVPYFSAGVTEVGLAGNPWYFAASMTYRQQGPLLARLVATNPDTKGRRVAAIITDTPNFDDAVEGWEEGVKAQNLDYYKTLRHPKGDTSWYNAYANDLASNGVEVVYILSSPVDYIRFAQQAKQNGNAFQFVGVGVSMGLNAVLNSGCPDIEGGIFFSPFPGLDWARDNVPEFFAAGAHFKVPTDDIALALWGTSSTLHEWFLQYSAQYGNDLTREDFRDMLDNSSVAGGVFPAVQFTPENHFGARTVHVLQADCSLDPPEYRTLHTFVSKF